MAKTDYEYEEIIKRGFPMMTVADLRFIDTIVEEGVREYKKDSLRYIDTDTKDHTYEERQRGENKGERLFEEYCTAKGIKFHRFGFDEKKGNIELFPLIHPLLRSLPDYLVPLPAKDMLYYIHVKGTNKLKKHDLEMYRLFERLFCSDKARLYIYFCFEGQPPIIKSLANINAMVASLPILRFTTDGKLYYNLRLDA